eukprot:CAMPEP_0185732394 /NCGR_PEP_ID=MMETSP1171-20130828/16020_1 /TAXON_ID=374046 /ORGANISM="Helicotheca tamensis, Strain CCMP826" /LENGTH=102 /DNA_ID=CAMNT_0028401867 /DNA_START=52 /DNA_END=360 /DNA_ORIENTATION=+
MTKEEEAKQLDSVTDVVQEKELDSSKANEAMAALSIGTEESAAKGSASEKHVSVSQEDVDIIVSELEVSEELAERTLREVGEDMGVEGKPALAAALRRLVVS